MILVQMHGKTLVMLQFSPTPLQPMKLRWSTTMRWMQLTDRSFKQLEASRRLLNPLQLKLQDTTSRITLTVAGVLIALHAGGPTHSTDVLPLQTPGPYHSFAPTTLLSRTPETTT